MDKELGIREYEIIILRTPPPASPSLVLKDKTREGLLSFSHPHFFVKNNLSQNHTIYRMILTS